MLAARARNSTASFKSPPGRRTRIKEIAMKPKLIATLALFVLAAVSLSACAGLPFTGGSSWKEEVLLHDGRTLIVERSIIRRGRHEIGQPPPVGEQTIRFKLPQSRKTVRWTSAYDDDLGGSDFNLLAVCWPFMS